MAWPNVSDKPWLKAEFRLSVIMGVWKEGDHRDWNAIRDWTTTLKPMLEGQQKV
jgi:hypothetical protein